MGGSSRPTNPPSSVPCRKIQLLLFYFQENDVKKRLPLGTVELQKLCYFVVVRGHPPYLSIYGSATLIILFSHFFLPPILFHVSNCAFLDEFLFLESFTIYYSKYVVLTQKYRTFYQFETILYAECSIGSWDTVSSVTLNSNMLQISLPLITLRWLEVVQG